ncbi:SDR family NAD(P)-dependent oxidoreductase [Curtobacterium sp. MCPF17_021]|uniref:SDR family oxidoreductase n=1 Tax=Curtobacterium sp. MCPF17_021 TaxID=2175639 RepID=UPI000DA8E8BC|nr:SDR family NAD(P)-dependent oxidoreductase [Curtobacterium sp. MCPF17_021]WIE82395.1 SDR family NAD(P)-dependent oxidoreductase [Curtobacterium sp. MCPF17_021]
MHITGNTILVTGGTSGIGLGLALRLQEQGNKVIIAGRRRALLDEITLAHPGVDGIELDVADPASIERARERLSVAHPDLNVLVNNAGIMLKEDLLDPADVHVAADHVLVNLLGTIRMTYAFLPALVGKDGAAVLNVTSAVAYVPYPSTPTYGATKAALHSFTESLRVQLASADAGVQVIEVVPSGVRTDLLDQRDNEQAMPLEDFLTEVLGKLRDDPDAPELVVDSARPIRQAVADGSYDAMLTAFSRL